jgi:SEC-C motif
MFMKKIGRNDPCPCGSGKKYKKCHMGKEDEMVLSGLEETSLSEMAARITSLPQVHYGRSREIVDALDIKALTGQSIGIRFVDLKAYIDLNLIGGTHPKATKGMSGGVLINLYKTLEADPNNLYIAISNDIEDSTIVHELAHALDYLEGSKMMPGTLEPLSLEMGIPVDHLEHPEEFGRWLDYLVKRFDVRLDADDAIISYLYQKEMLIKGKEIREKNGLILKSKSGRILRFLSDNREEVHALIRDLPGYLGSRSR